MVHLSTHEAIFRRVPMLSAPFFWDQPALAARCAAMGLAVPLGRPAHEEIGREAVRAALALALERRPSMREALERAPALELEVMARRGEVHARIAEIAARGRG